MKKPVYRKLTDKRMRLFPKRRQLTEEEVDELRKKYKKFIEENNTDGFVEGSLDNLKDK